jgi:sugar phosphate isomerase/epimerase
MPYDQRFMLRLCAFADEISPSLDEQVRVCLECGIRHIELRSVEKINVLDFDRAMRERIRTTLRENQMLVACIGSPIGKVPITEPWEKHFERFRIAVESAEFFGTRMIRIFSYYPPTPAEDVQKHRDEVMRRMRAKVRFISGRDLVLVHENEHAIYGQSGEGCLDLLRTVHSPRLRCAFDFANFIVDGERPRDNWTKLKSYTVHFHIKDARLSDRAIVPAGAGDGAIGAILADAYASGYRGFVSLEPHLAAAGQFSGFSGPDLFRTAVDALRRVCREHDVPLEGN